MDDAPATPRPPGRPGRKPSEVPKHALNLRLEADVIYRLKRHALDTGRTVSEIVSRWARECLVGPGERDSS